MESVKNSGYKEYQALGGIINEKDYASALAKMKENRTVDEVRTDEAKVMARAAGVELGAEVARDPRVVLYDILQSDVNTSDPEYRDIRLSDQNFFAEALRMLGDKESLLNLRKFIDAHPYISFDNKKDKREDNTYGRIIHRGSR